MKKNDHLLRRRKFTVSSALAGLALLGSQAIMPAPVVSQSQSVIVQGPDLTSAKAAVLDVGGEVTHELGIIGAVGARLTAEQQKKIEAKENVRVRSDGTVQTNPAQPDG